MIDRRRALIGVAKGGLPAEYQEVKYLESSGTQFIYSGDILDYSIKYTVKTKVHPSPPPVLSQNSLFGWYTHFTIAPFSTTEYGLNVNSIEQMQANKMDVDDAFALAEIEIVRLSAAQWSMEEITAVIDGKTFSHRYGNKIEKLANDFGLFGTRKYNSSNVFFGITKMYYLILYHDGVPARDYIPCLRKSDGKPGMYDLCGSISTTTGTPFYVNNKTGEFGYETLDGIYVPPT